MNANVILSIDLSEGLLFQLDNLDKAMEALKQRGFSFEKRISLGTVNTRNVKGPYELLYLKVSKKNRMKVMDGTTDREAAAKRKLEQEYPDELQNVVIQEDVNEHSTEDADAPIPSIDEKVEDEDNLF